MRDNGFHGCCEISLSDLLSCHAAAQAWDEQCRSILHGGTKKEFDKNFNRDNVARAIFLHFFNISLLVLMTNVSVLS